MNTPAIRLVLDPSLDPDEWYLDVLSPKYGRPLPWIKYSAPKMCEPVRKDLPSFRVVTDERQWRPGR